MMAISNHPLGKTHTYEAARVAVWLWPGLHAESWVHKLTCGHLLSQATQKLLPSQSTPAAMESWMMILAMMLNGTEKIYGDPDPFNSEDGVSPELQAWRLLVLMSFAFLPNEGRVVGNLGRITLNSLDIRVGNRSEFHKTHSGLGADCVHYLNYEGQGNSVVWFKSLDVKNYQNAICERLVELLKTWQDAIALAMGDLPITSLFSSHLMRHKLALVTLENTIVKMVPKALSNIAEMMQPLQDNVPLTAQKQLGESAKKAYQLKVIDLSKNKLQRFTKIELLRLLTATTALFDAKNLN